ncbi:hypothetical protein L249_4574, partial [Ophiocordyceps polyrhachis-furcata BCC 54312]
MFGRIVHQSYFRPGAHETSGAEIRERQDGEQKTYEKKKRMSEKKARRRRLCRSFTYPALCFQPPPGLTSYHNGIVTFRSSITIYATLPSEAKPERKGVTTELNPQLAFFLVRQASSDKQLPQAEIRPFSRRSGTYRGVLKHASVPVSIVIDVSPFYFYISHSIGSFSPFFSFTIFQSNMAEATTDHIHTVLISDTLPFPSLMTGDINSTLSIYSLSLVEPYPLRHLSPNFILTTRHSSLTHSFSHPLPFLSPLPNIITSFSFSSLPNCSCMNVGDADNRR